MSTTLEEMLVLRWAQSQLADASAQIKAVWDRDSDSYDIAIAIDRQNKALEAQIRYLQAWHPVALEAEVTP